MFKGLSGWYYHRKYLLMQEYFDDELASQVFVIYNGSGGSSGDYNGTNNQIQL